MKVWIQNLITSRIHHHIYSYNHCYNRIDKIQTMRLNSRKPQLNHNCSSRHSNCHLSSSRWHRLTHEGETPVTQPKRCASLIPLVKQCASALMKWCALTIVIILNNACVAKLEMNSNLHFFKLELHLQHPPSNDRGRNPLGVWNEMKEKEGQVKAW